MKKALSGFLFALSLTCTGQQASLWVETESFQQKGGWVVDQQSMDEMGSPYLMAHGMGEAVADASTLIRFPETGTYHIYVRTRNWTAPWSNIAAGRFQVLLNGKAITQDFGNGSSEWNWVHGGSVRIKALDTQISLHDLSGFNGRCDALYFTKDANDLPPNMVDAMDLRKTELRSEALSIQEEEFEFVVVGGGIAGTCAAISELFCWYTSSTNAER